MIDVLSNLNHPSFFMLVQTVRGLHYLETRLIDNNRREDGSLSASGTLYSVLISLKTSGI